MFLYIWRHLQHSIADKDGIAVANGSGFTQFGGGLLKGTKVFPLN